MRQQFLTIAFTMMIMCLLQNVFLNSLIMVLALMYLKLFKKRKIIICFLFLVVFNTHFLPNDLEVPSKKDLLVVDIKTNYIIASTGEERVVLYNVQGVHFNDWIQVNGVYERIHSNKNLFLFNFQEYMEQKGITHCMNVNSFVITKASNSLQTRVYQYINEVKQTNVKEHFLKTFYRIDENRSDISFFMYTSGLHLSFLATLISSLVKKNRDYCSIVICLIYIAMFPFHFFIARMLLASLVRLLCKTFNTMDQLAISTILLLFIQPNYIFEIGFVLGFIFSIVGVFKVRKVNKHVLQILLLIPIQLFYFNECNLVSLVFFSLIRILSSINFLISIVGLFVVPLHNIVLIGGDIVSTLLTVLTYPIDLIGHPNGLWFFIWALYVLYLISNVKKKYVYLFALLLLYQMNMSKLNFFGEVTFLDVGQGDSILIHEPMYGEVVLIDVAGSLYKDIASDIILPSLKARGIRKIDKVIISHMDYDHYGGLKQLQQMIAIDAIIYKSDEINLKYVSLTNLSKKEYDDENDSSQVLYGSLFGLRYLFMGDASKRVESDILDEYSQLRVDVLKVSHHGSNTASSEDFIQSINPMVSIISSGYKNRYNHPHVEVIETLEAYQSTIFDTQKQGSYTIYFSRYLNFYKTASKQFGIIEKVKK